MATSNTFRPEDVGARQRLLHWMNAAASLLVFIVAGPPGLWLAYLVGLLVLHARADRARGFNAMDRLLQAREKALTLEWSAFLGAPHRRTMSLARRRPHRFLAAACLFIVLQSTLVAGAHVADADAASRLGMALVASAAMWAALFGLRRRTPLVFGIDGVRVRDTFVAYATVQGFAQRPDGIVIERTASLPSVLVPTPDPETTERLASHLASERDLALRRRAEPTPPLPAAGFRESASQEGWRVRLLDAASADERDAVIARVSPDELREVLDETADPSLEEALVARLRKGP